MMPDVISKPVRVVVNDNTPSQVQPPFDYDAEQAVIGSVLIDSEAFVQAAPYINANDFYAGKHQIIWQAFLDLAAKSASIDYLTLQSHLAANNNLDAIGGPAYLTRLITTTPTAFNIQSYAKIVGEEAVRRSAILASGEILKSAYDRSVTIPELQGIASTEFNGVFRASADTAPNMKVVMRDYVDQRTAQMEGKAQPDYIKPSLRTLDEKLSGTSYRRSQFIIVAGRPGTGKSTFMLQEATAAAKQGKHVVFYPYEMSRDETIDRMVTQATGIPSEILLNPALMSDAMRQQFFKACAYIETLPIRIIDPSSTAFEDAANQVRAIHTTQSVDMVVLDYIGLMTSRERRYPNREQEISAISRGAKRLAAEIDCVMMSGAQLNRNVEHRSNPRPSLSDLRDSGSLEQDANVVMFLYKDERWDDPVRTDIYVAKNRGGKKPTIHARFVEEKTRFEDARLHTLDFSSYNR